ncbi:MAG: tRNA glutamyl-Q(34) synthetase GluQRS [Aquabacterium sp.]|uniref:tRNA glutamyl-Q(34) synthetase GluQRS n=1 Tax=Aquabacterium sp. TaxID=1872578 RepID=UPI0025BAFD2D|nr:tRNA glutamyl-Q(34) synthetase GluQRS [Aquabacterium sp.]MBI5927006.1 tRNA glutamyl-Q(34) synthetase GluQRS [Aquabacterium sp.]
MSGYVGRFAPSPTGPLHAGSLVAALASWLDARAHGGRWLVRIEDVDLPRCIPGADQIILAQLARCGLIPDETPLYQSQRGEVYQQALDQLIAAHHAYPCGCTRADIAQANAALGLTKQRHGDLVYPGTCRPDQGGLHGKPARAWRLQVPDAPDDLLTWQDRALGTQQQHLASAVGDFVIKRADGLWAYQLAVVADDAAQGVTDVVRGADLCDNTPRQILLQRWLGLPTPHYLHTPLVLGDNGEKLSKQNGAQALDLRSPLAALQAAGAALGLSSPASAPGDWLAEAVEQWRDRWPPLQA